MKYLTLLACILALTLSLNTFAQQPESNVPPIQVLPLPHHQASFQLNARELTRAHFAPNLRRPFLYPIIGPSGRSLTRMGHPHDPIGHSHHNSVWFTHHKVNGVNFWLDRGKDAGQIVHQRVEQFLDGKQTNNKTAVMLSTNHWNDPQNKTLLIETRRIEVQPLTQGQYYITIALHFKTPNDQPVTFEQNPFGVIGVRLAKTIGVHDGKGRILNSNNLVNEKQIFRKPAKWVDYSGYITPKAIEGITLLDHPQNINHPAPFHVRNDGWMGACLTLNKPITVTKDNPLKLLYRLYIHSGAPDVKTIEPHWQTFSKYKFPPMTKIK